MSIRITNLLNTPFGVPEPVGEVLGPRATATYPEVPWSSIINDDRFVEMQSLQQIRVENLETSTATALSATTQDIDLWVAATGSDEASGTQSDPYATFTRAMQDVPFIVNHTVHIRIGAGTYQETIANATRSYGADGFLCIEGVGAPTVDSGPYAVTSWGALPSGAEAYAFITCAGASWTTDEFYGKWARVTAGTAAGFIFPVHYNDATTIIFHHVTPAWVGTITEIEILDGPATIMEFDRGICFASPEYRSMGDPSAAWDACPVAIAGVRFRTDSVGWNPFMISSLSAWLRFVAFETPSPTLSGAAPVLFVNRADVNYNGPCFSGVFDNALFDQWDNGGFSIEKGTVPWAGAHSPGLRIQEGYIWCASTRFKMSCYSTCEVTHVIVGSLQGHSNLMSLYNSRIDPVGMSLVGTAAVDVAMGDIWLGEVWIESAGGFTDAVYVRSCRGQFRGLHGNSAKISGYGLRLRACCLINAYSSTDLAGTTGDIYWVQTATGASYPSAGAGITDGQGGWVVGML